MTYNVFAIVSGEDVGDDRMYPELSPADHRYPVMMYAPDTNPASFVAKGFRVTRHSGDRKNEVLKLADVRIDVYLTGDRVIFHCDKYDKGGGWSGWGGAGIAVAVVANGVSKARAAMRRRGKALVGQVRYPWLQSVGGSPKLGFGDVDQLRFIMRDGNDDWIWVDVSFAKGTPVIAMARDIAQRAARHRLENDPNLGEEERQHLIALTNAPDLMPEKGKFSHYKMPTYYRTVATTARYPEPKVREVEQPRAPVLPPPVMERPVAESPRHTAPARVEPTHAVPGATVGGHCVQCGKAHSMGATFCARCGTPIATRI